MSEALDDLGSFERLTDDEKKRMRASLMKSETGVVAMTLEKKTAIFLYLEFLTHLSLTSEDHIQDYVKTNIDGIGELEFWPLSDTWYSERKKQYGTGIVEVCMKIIKWRQKKGQL